MAQFTALNETGNGAAEQISFILPYTVRVTVEGVASLLFHRYDIDSVAEKGAAAKGSKAKKTDDIDSYVYRTPTGELGIPGANFAATLTDARNGAAKYAQDPRSPRKSALDLYRAAVQPLTEVASLGVVTWDFLDRRRVLVQRNAVTRTRPAMLPGWRCSFDLLVTMPEYILPASLQATLELAGRAVGVGDFRPTYGRFRVTHFEVLEP